MPAKYETIADDIQAQIKSGRLGPGDKLPSTSELMRHYAVSETVIRYAMIILRERRLVTGEQGRGVYVTGGS